MLLRRTRTTLPTTDQLLSPTMLNFRIVEEELSKKRRDSKAYYDKSASMELGPLNIGTYAYAKLPPQQRGKPWIYGEVINHKRPRSYTIRTTQGRTIRRNRVQQKPTAPPPPPPPTVTIPGPKSKQARVTPTFTRIRQWKLQNKHSPVSNHQPSHSLPLLRPQSVHKS